VDDVTGLEVSGGCDDGFTSGYSAFLCDDLVTFLLYLWSSFSSDRSCDSTSEFESVVGCVYYRIDLEVRDVPSYEF